LKYPVCVDNTHLLTLLLLKYPVCVDNTHLLTLLLLKYPVCVDNTHLLTLLLSNGPSKAYFDPTLVRGHHWVTWALTL